MDKEKFKQVFKGELKELISYFDITYEGETYEVAFNNRKRLAIKKSVYSYDWLYILGRSPDGKYVLFERYFE